MSLELYSVQDIQLYQALPDLPPLIQSQIQENALSLRGKVSIGEIMNRFQQLESEGSMVLKGYAIPKFDDFVQD